MSKTTLLDYCNENNLEYLINEWDTEKNDFMKNFILSTLLLVIFKIITVFLIAN